MPLSDVFSIRKYVIDEYENFVTSYINIRDKRIKDIIAKEIGKGTYWPEPLLQFNPSFMDGRLGSELCIEYGLHPDLHPVIGAIPLYKHQVEAIKKGIRDQDFVVTSGTGSGKSLTYIVPIFHKILSGDMKKAGATAIIVYPMNALINSQVASIETYCREFKKETGRDFPVKCRKYTGQEKEKEREEMRDNIPHVILTNYMMLELILTRHSEQRIQNAIKENLSILVFDELHMYRGRQGADIALLIRRLRALSRRDVVCIGTSATMAKCDSIEKEQKIVADFASQIFGIKITTGQIIREYLKPSFSLNGEQITIDSVRAVLDGRVKCEGSEAELSKNPLANWIEHNAALGKKENILVRRTPLSLHQLSEKLAGETGIAPDICERKIKKVLLWIMKINEEIDNENKTRGKNRPFYLPYKLHQFISQTGVLYITLDEPGKRDISLEPVHHKNKAGKKIFYYQTVFSRYSGCEYICVTLDPDNRQLLPRDYDDYYSKGNQPEEDDENHDHLMGYILTDTSIWNPSEDLEKLPGSWFKKDKKGEIRYDGDLPLVLPKYKDRLPGEIWYDIDGRYSEKPELPHKGWYMPAPLLFDPTSGVLFNPGMWEMTKLSRLGSEGRSTSTTVLSLAVLKALSRAGFTEKEQKIMSFSDNRQDAALQSGHFNDFLRVAEIRAAIYRGISRHNELDFTTIDQVVMEELNIPEEDYARSVSKFSYAQKNNQQAFKKYLLYRILEDLKRSWKITIPNLEATGLLYITYSHFDEICREEEVWKDIPVFGRIDTGKRKELLFQILDYFRKLFAINSKDFLTREAIERNSRDINQLLQEPWKFKENEKIIEPNWLYLERPSKRVEKQRYTGSIGPLSYLGRYIKDELTHLRMEGRPKDNEYIEIMETVLEVLCGANWIIREQVESKSGQPCFLYQLGINAVIWKKGDGKSVPADPVRNRRYRDFKLLPNTYFKNLYKTDFTRFKKMISAEHTGQLLAEDRIKRENEFREGKLSALFCSPTMELGIDIAELNVVHMRNVPPEASNYAQRSGRAGRSGQAALVFTNCSLFSPHDRHYFKRQTEMVSGSVAAPRIDVTNEELIRTHLHAIILAIKRIPELTSSLKDLFDWNKPGFPVRQEVIDILHFTEEEKAEMIHRFNSVISNIYEKLQERVWFYKNWASDTIDSIKKNFEKALGRWKWMYLAVQQEIENITRKIKSHVYKAGSREMKENKQKLTRAEFERGVLCNDTNFFTFSEFYPYRYLAAEGFLPGYNFCRLPIRVSIPVGENVEYISRPRPIAIREFGPQNIIYHKGIKHRIDKMMFQAAEKQLRRVIVAPDSGFVIETDENVSVSPFNQEPLSGKNRPVVFHDLMYMSETKAERAERISCEEEIRTSMGYDIRTYFSVPGGMDRVVTASLFHEGKEYLYLKYIPACRIYTFNLGWKIAQEEGFYIGSITGKWKRKKSVEKESANTIRGREENLKVGLLTYEGADALYLIPIKILGLCRNGVVTLQYALKQSIINFFGIEEREIGVELMGEHPNILIYEAAQGSLGILSRFVENKNIFRLVIQEAMNICRFNDAAYMDDASYDDLLSYYNQRDHDKISRFLIKKALEQLLLCDVVLPDKAGEKEYRKQYEYLYETYDKNSDCEKRFLDYLYGRGLRLPDKAQPKVPGIYVQPDFLYKNPDIYIFCDGGVHNSLVVAEDDYEKRRALSDSGYIYLVYHYNDDISQFISGHADIFRKVLQ